MSLSGMMKRGTFYFPPAPAGSSGFPSRREENRGKHATLDSRGTTPGRPRGSVSSLRVFRAPSSIRRAAISRILLATFDTDRVLASLRAPDPRNLRNERVEPGEGADKEGASGRAQYP